MPPKARSQGAILQTWDVKQGQKLLTGAEQQCSSVHKEKNHWKMLVLREESIS